MLDLRRRAKIPLLDFEVLRAGGISAVKFEISDLRSFRRFFAPSRRGVFALKTPLSLTPGFSRV